MFRTPLFRQFLVKELFAALEAKAQQKLDPQNPMAFVQAEAYNHGKADLLDYFLTISA